MDSGLEFGFNSNPRGNPWSWFFNYSWQDMPEVTGIDISEVNLPPENRVNFGLAFQITDDLLDATGDAAEAGKAVGKDQAQGKATLVALQGVDEARAIAARFCHNAMESLDLYGDKADLLRNVTRSVTDRRA